ncbi:glycosyltransferase [Streptomyces sp. NPDC004629]|uniref:glycosyltransferase n=1 Tax=Streptomyces sp. NPDC004629 TaxID=3364705 RepID=UPI003691D11C
MTTSSSPSESRLEPSVPEADKATDSTAEHGVTIVIPTYNEAANIAELLSRISASVPPGQETSVLFVDDSTDDTPEVIQKEAARLPLEVSVHHRADPVGGLGGAVMEGIARSNTRWIVVMDADLQHPPALLPQLIAKGEESGAGLVVASRYTDGGNRSGLGSRYRVLVSGASTSLAKALFPRLLRDTSDPMSGYFAIRRELVGRAERSGALRPLGYKILLELIVRCRPHAIAEVAYDFGVRHAGESKSTVREGLRFLRHLIRLRTGGMPSRALAFGAIGLSGFLPNLAVRWVLTHSTDLHYATAEVVANQVGALWNFVFTDRLLYRGRGRLGRHTRLLSFIALANADLVVRIPLMVLLVSGVGLTPVPATAIALCLVSLLRFLCVDRFLYR